MRKQSKALEELHIITKGNKETPEVMVRIPHPKSTYEEFTITL